MPARVRTYRFSVGAVRGSGRKAAAAGPMVGGRPSRSSSSACRSVAGGLAPLDAEPSSPGCTACACACPGTGTETGTGTCNIARAVSPLLVTLPVTLLFGRRRRAAPPRGGRDGTGDGYEVGSDVGCEEGSEGGRASRVDGVADALKAANGGNAASARGSEGADEGCAAEGWVVVIAEGDDEGWVVVGTDLGTEGWVVIIADGWVVIIADGWVVIIADGWVVVRSDSSTEGWVVVIAEGDDEGWVVVGADSGTEGWVVVVIAEGWVVPVGCAVSSVGAGGAEGGTDGCVVGWLDGGCNTGCDDGTWRRRRGGWEGGEGTTRRKVVNEGVREGYV